MSKSLTSSADDRRQLEAEALAKRGRGLQENIMTLDDCSNDFSLEWTIAESVWCNRVQGPPSY